MWYWQLCWREVSLTRVPCCRMSTRHASSVTRNASRQSVTDQTSLEQLGNGNDCDMVGPPDAVSNIRPLRLRTSASEAEKDIQRLQLQIWALKHHFWTQHNTHFKQKKAVFAQGILKRKQLSEELTDDDDVSKVTADELSIFYKDFLDKTYKEQMSFTREWMKLNTLLTWKQFQHNLRTVFGYAR